MLTVLCPVLALRLRGACVRDQERGGARRDAQLQGRAARHGGAILRTQVRIAAISHHYCIRHYNVGRFHQTVYLLNQLSSDLDRWGLRSLSIFYSGTFPKPFVSQMGGFARKERDWGRIRRHKISVQIRAHLRGQGRDPHLRREVHWVRHDKEPDM